MKRIIVQLSPFFLYSLLFLSTGCVTNLRNAPAPNSTVEEKSVKQVASKLRRAERERTAGMGGGESMAPIYGENTIIVTNPIDFEDLEPDMIVAYRSKEGRRIVHKLSHREGDKWVAIGINNRNYDAEPVTRKNLIGVVYAVLNAKGDTPAIQ